MYKTIYKASVISFTKYGAALSHTIKNILRQNNCHATLYIAKKDFKHQDIQNITCPLNKWAGIHFKEDDIIIFIGACGIAVRSIAPFIQSKCTDPAVIVTDDMGQNIISLLSGHLGKANEWTKILAAAIHANPVITTSSDIHGKIAIDLFALQNNLYIDNMENARRIQAAIIENKPVAIYSDAEVKGIIPENFFINNIKSSYNCIDTDYNIIISPFTAFKETRQFKNNQTLHLIPRVITLGTGCRKNKTYNEITSFINKTLKSAQISIHAISDIATIDIKKNETGITMFAENNSLPLLFYSAAELETITESVSPSSFVKKTTGTDNICERAALMPQGEKELILTKQAENGITVAAAIKKWSINFE